MSGYTSAPRLFRLTAPTITSHDASSSVRAWAQGIWARLVRMRRAAETRRELGALDPRLLSDIGVSRAEASREAERWPWDLAPQSRAGADR